MSVITPSTTGAFPRRDLTGYVNEFIQVDPWIGAKILLPLDVEEQASSFARIPAQSRAQLPAHTRRAADGSYQRTKSYLEEDTYDCEIHGIEKTIDHAKVEKYSSMLDMERIAVVDATNELMRAYEKRVADLVHNTSTFPLSGSTGLGVSTEWDSASATPASDVKVGIEAIRSQTGATGKSMCLQICHYTWQQLALVDDVREAMSLGFKESPGEIETAALARYFGVGEVIVGEASYDSADEGQTEVMADIWDDEYAFLFVKAPGAEFGAEVMQLGRTFVWGKFAEMLTVEEYDAPNLDGHVVRAKQAVDEKLFGTRFGFLLGNISA